MLIRLQASKSSPKYKSENETGIIKEKNIPPEERHQIIDQLRLI